MHPALRPTLSSLAKVMSLEWYDVVVTDTGNFVPEAYLFYILFMMVGSIGIFGISPSSSHNPTLTLK